MNLAPFISLCTFLRKNDVDYIWFLFMKKKKRTNERNILPLLLIKFELNVTYIQIQHCTYVQTQTICILLSPFHPFPHSEFLFTHHGIHHRSITFSLKTFNFRGYIKIKKKKKPKTTIWLKCVENAGWKHINKWSNAFYENGNYIHYTGHCLHCFCFK